MATIVRQTAPNASTKIAVYWIVGIAAIFFIAYMLRTTGPISDPIQIIAPSPVQSFPVPQ